MVLAFVLLESGLRTRHVFCGLFALFWKGSSSYSPIFFMILRSTEFARRFSIFFPDPELSWGLRILPFPWHSHASGLHGLARAAKAVSCCVCWPCRSPRSPCVDRLPSHTTRAGPDVIHRPSLAGGPYRSSLPLSGEFLSYSEGVLPFVIAGGGRRILREIFGWQIRRRGLWRAFPSVFGRASLVAADGARCFSTFEAKASSGR